MSFNQENNRDYDGSTQETESSQDQMDEEYAEYFERKRQYELMRECMKIFDYEKYGYDIEGNNDIRTDESMPKPMASSSNEQKSESRSAPPLMEFFEQSSNLLFLHVYDRSDGFQKIKINRLFCLS